MRRAKKKQGDPVAPYKSPTIRKKLGLDLQAFAEPDARTYELAPYLEYGNEKRNGGDYAGYMSPTIHELKVWPRYFKPIIEGRKKFEIRKNDRNFAEGDVVILREWVLDRSRSDDGDGYYTGRQVRKRVGFITDYAQQPGYVVFGLV